MTVNGRPRPFGRRGGSTQLTQVAISPPSSARSELGAPIEELSAPIEELARRIGVNRGDATGSVATDARGMLTPWSGRAAILAGLATACLTAGALLVQNQTDPLQSAALNSVSSLVGADGKALVPVLLLLSLWEAGQATFFSVLTSHFVLRRLGATSLSAYATASGAAGLLLAAACQAIGLGRPDSGYYMAAATGACAGFFYRLFAGARPAS